MPRLTVKQLDPQATLEGELGKIARDTATLIIRGKGPTYEAYKAKLLALRDRNPTIQVTEEP
jgi:hypothetical protein